MNFKWWGKVQKYNTESHFSNLLWLWKLQTRAHMEFPCLQDRVYSFQQRAQSIFFSPGQIPAYDCSISYME